VTLLGNYIPKLDNDNGVYEVLSEKTGKNRPWILTLQKGVVKRGEPE
jgi:hypothetical protein